MVYVARGREHGHEVEDWFKAERETQDLVTRTTEDLISRIRAEYLEMPGLSLSCEQAARLLGLDCLVTTVALGELERDAFLVRTRKGQFVRSDTTMRCDDSSAAPRLVEVR